MREARSPGRRSADEAARTRRAILDNALRLFSEKGFDLTSVRDIAAASDISHGVLRYHFGSKMDIWISVMDRAFDLYREEMMPVVEAAVDSDNALEAFRKVVSVFIRLTCERPEFARLFIRETSQQGPRADYCQTNFSALHLAIGELFNRARSQSSALEFHSNDSFFYALISLTHFRLLHPGVAFAPELQDSEQVQALVMKVLFR